MTTKTQQQFATKEDLKKLETGIGKDIRVFKDEIRGDIKGFKDEIREDSKKYKNEMKTYMGVLYEKFDNEVKVVAEQYSGIERRLTRVESKTDMLVETVGDIKMELSVIKEDVGELKTDMKEVKDELLPVATRKVDKLDRRVAILESRA